MNHFPWNAFLLGAGVVLAGFGLLALNSLCSPAARRRGKRAHFAPRFRNQRPRHDAHRRELSRARRPLSDDSIGSLSSSSGSSRRRRERVSTRRALLTWVDFAGSRNTRSSSTSTACTRSRAIRRRSRCRFSRSGSAGSRSRSRTLSLLPLLIGGWYLYSWLEEELELVPVFAERYREYSRATPRMVPSPDALAHWIAEGSAVNRPAQLSPKGGSEERK